MAKKIIDAQEAFVNTENVTPQVEAVEEKPKKTRKKATKKVNETEISEAPVPMSEDAMNKPEQHYVNMRELVDYCKQVNGDRDAILKFFIEKEIVVENCASYDELMTAATIAFRNSCVSEEGSYERNTNALNLFTEVMIFYLYTRIDFADMSYEEVYNALVRYHLNSVLDDITGNCGQLYSYVNRLVDDYENDHYSVQALVKNIYAVINVLLDNIASFISNPELLEILKSLSNVITANQGDSVEDEN